MDVDPIYNLPESLSDVEEGEGREHEGRCGSPRVIHIEGSAGQVRYLSLIHI